MVNASPQDMTLINKRPIGKAAVEKLFMSERGKSDLLLSNENNRWNL